MLALSLICAACATRGGAPVQPSSPSSEQVARRAFALAAVVYRSGIEQNAGNAEAEAFREQILQWLDTAGVTPALEPQELKLLQAPLGTLTETQAMDAGWRAEGLGVLAWALDRWELDPNYAPSDALAIAGALGFMEPEGLELLKSPKLRPISEQEELARRSYLVHMRLRQAYEGASSTTSFAKLATDLRVDEASLGLIEDDLTINGIRLTAVPEEILRIVISTVVEQHRAANWLLGDNPLYSEVSYSLRGTQ